MDWYMARGLALDGSKLMDTAMYIEKARNQSVTVEIGNFLTRPLSSFLSSVDRSKAQSSASGRRSPRSINFPSVILFTRAGGIPNRPVQGRISGVVGNTAGVDALLTAEGCVQVAVTGIGGTG